MFNILLNQLPLNYGKKLTTKNLFKNCYKILAISIILFASFTAQATVYYVSEAGDDNNSGTSSTSPWRSLAKVNSFSYSPGDKILFNRGDQWVGTLTATSSGTSGSTIIYGAYGSGARPIIYSSERISDWTVHSGNIYKASFGKDINQLFYDGKRMKLARDPGTGWHTINSVGSSTEFTSTDLDGSIDYKGGTVVARTSRYTMFSRIITNSSSQTLTVDSRPSYSYGVDEGFFVCDKLDLLDEAGEWYYDSSTNTVYFWAPNGGNPENYEVRGATTKYNVKITDKNNIKLENLELAHAATTSVYISNSNYVTVDNCQIISPDLMGVYTTSGSSDYATVSNCYIFQANGNGIRFKGENGEAFNNTIKEIGLHKNVNKKTFESWDNFGTGIYSRGDDQKFTYNTIINSGYCGINWKGERSIINYNYINGACQVLDDGGGIYTYNGSDYTKPGAANSVVKNNIVLNVYGNKNGYPASYDAGSGIYMDDRTHDVEISNNTVSGTTYGIFLHNCGRINVTNNKVINSLVALLTGGEEENSYYYDNIIYASNRNGDVSWWKDSHQRMVKNDGASAVYDRNQYIHHYATDNQFSNWYNFTEWKSKTGQDGNSTFDGSTLADGEHEKLFYNNTRQSKSISLGSYIYREINGESVSGSITLQPFTSKILIKTNTETTVSNRYPSIQDQTFEISGDIQLNEFVGQVVASDPDAGQTLRYAITSGNEENLFYINSSTGEIFANADAQITENKSVALAVQVTDDASSPLSSSANITISITAMDNSLIVDATAPVVSSFSVPSTSSSLTVSVTSFDATDDQSLAGYLLTETSDSPVADNSGWSPTAPTEHVFTTEGSKVLYAWAKDAAGNVSTPLSNEVTITLPDMSATYSEYLFEETSGTTVFDSECTNDGILVNEELRTTGAQGQGVEFTGTGYANMGNCYGANVEKEVSLSAWVKPSAVSSGYQGIIMHGGPNIDTYALYIENNNKRVAFKTTGTTSSWTYVDNITTLWDGNWHHLVVTYNGAEKIIYLDGNIIVKEAATGPIESGEGYNMLVGAGRDESPASLLYEGLIDEVRVYNYALTDSTVKELYNSVATKTVTVYAEEDIYICNGESYEGWTEVGQYERTLISSSGGDSIVTTNLYVNPVYNITEDITIKEGETYEGWTESGQYQRVLTSIDGCDSTVTTNLAVLQAIYTTEDVFICDGESYEGWTEAGQYQRTLEASNGADSTVTTNLTVHLTYEIAEDITIKEGDSYEGWTESGQYKRTLATVNGCDSVVTTSLTVLQTLYTTEDISICDGENYQEWTESGQYQRTLESSTGADSIVTTNLTVHPTYDIVEDITVNEGESYEGWTESGQYQRTLTTINGCDSVVTTNLTVHNSLYTTEDIFICDGENYQGWTESGQYQRTLETFAGADSIVTTNLTVHPTYDIVEDININEGESYEGWTESGQYQRTLTTVNGCDSTVTTNLTVQASEVIPTVYTEEDINICDGEEYMGWTETGIYERTLQSSSGGDSIITTNLYVHSTYSITEDITIKEGESYEGWTVSGQYVRTLTTEFGCDSIVTTNLTVVNSTSSFSEYLFEESSGTTAFDSQGLNNGTIFNEVNRVKGIAGNGLEFNGLGYVKVGQSFGKNVQNEVTLSAWIKPDITTGNYQALIMHGGPNTDTYAIYIRYNANRIAFKTTGTTSSWTYIDNVNSLWDGDWHHLAVTYDGTEKIIYLDGQVLIKESSTGEIESGEGYNLYIGAGRDEASPKLLYEGQIDQVRIYNYALSASDINNQFHADNLLQTVYAEEDVYICEGENYEGWAESGQYERTLASSTGGDSIITTNLYVNPSYSITEDITINDGEDYEGWTETGTYTRTLTTEYGCDSIVTTNLTVISLSQEFSEFSEYLFEESGITVFDSQGTNHGTIFNEENRVNGVNGNGLEFNGLGYVKIGQSFGQNVQNEVTLSAWIKPDKSNGNYQAIVMHGGPNTDTYAIYIRYNANRIAFKTTGTSSSWTYIDNVNSLWDGNWHHLAVTYDGTEKIIYLDSQVLIKEESTGEIESGEGYNLYIGAGRDEENPKLLYEGQIDEVRVYNYALSGSEISTLYYGTDGGNQIKVGRITGVTDLEETGKEVNFEFYPNPATSYITIDYDIQPDIRTRIQIINAAGNVVYNESVESVSNRINVSNLPSGVYYIRSVNQKQQIVKKLVKR